MRYQHLELGRRTEGKDLLIKTACGTFRSRLGGVVAGCLVLEGWPASVFSVAAPRRAWRCPRCLRAYQHCEMEKAAEQVRPDHRPLESIPEDFYAA